MLDGAGAVADVPAKVVGDELGVVILDGTEEVGVEAEVVAKDESGWFVFDEAENVEDVAEDDIAENELGVVVLN